MTKVKVKEVGIFVKLRDIQVEVPDEADWIGSYEEELDDAICNEVDRILKIDRDKTIHGMITEVGIDYWDNSLE